MGAFVTRDGARERVTQDVYVHAVVPNEGQGAMAGSKSPAVFASLDDAQSMLEMEGQLTRLSLAYDDTRPEEELRAAREAVEQRMDGLLTAEDVGLVFTADDATASLTVSPTPDCSGFLATTCGGCGKTLRNCIRTPPF